MRLRELEKERLKQELTEKYNSFKASGEYATGDFGITKSKGKVYAGVFYGNKPKAVFELIYDSINANLRDIKEGQILCI